MSNQKEYLTIVISADKGKLKPILTGGDFYGGIIKSATAYDAVRALHRVGDYLMENEEENADIIEELHNIVVGK